MALVRLGTPDTSTCCSKPSLLLSDGRQHGGRCQQHAGVSWTVWPARGARRGLTQRINASQDKLQPGVFLIDDLLQPRQLQKSMCYVMLQLSR